jgi:hypothetical protein
MYFAKLYNDVAYDHEGKKSHRLASLYERGENQGL